MRVIAPTAQKDRRSPVHTSIALTRPFLTEPLHGPASVKVEGSSAITCLVRRHPGYEMSDPDPDSGPQT